MGADGGALADLVADDQQDLLDKPGKFICEEMLNVVSVTSRDIATPISLLLAARTTGTRTRDRSSR
jgi:hypothetical protein